MSFSERYGFKPTRTKVQVEGIDSTLKNSIWNILNLYVLGPNQYESRTINKRTDTELFYIKLWKDFFKEPIDNMYRVMGIDYMTIKSKFFSLPWYEIYDLIEFIAKNCNIKFFEETINSTLESEKSGYRLIGTTVTPITNTEELDSIDSAITQNQYSGCSAHLKRAVELYSDRRNPDYRNSIKESISAIESLTKEITSDKKGGINNALSELEKSGSIHQSLKKSLSALYGYTSDENGIRHAILDEPNVSESDARFMLVVCSAFSNYLIEKAR